MKKNVIKLFVSTTILFGIIGCSEEFLDPVRNTSTLTNEDFEDNIDINPALVEGTLTGAYGLMKEPAAIITTSTRHYDIGHKGMDIWMDMLCGDMALSTNTYGWYAATSNLTFTTDFTREENEIVWNYLYKMINIANSVIESAGGENANPTTDEAKAILGQGKALRAYGYFYLTQMFQRSYNPSQEILPYYTTDVATNSFAKVPASQIYGLIVSDLTSAIDLLENFNRNFKFQINKPVAQGLLAYTYAAMGNYPLVETLTEDIINNSGHPLTTTSALAYPGAGSGFNELSTPSWMWGFDLTTDLGIGLVSWWGQVDYFSYSYAAAGDRKAMDNSLFNQITSTDIRKSQFNQASGNNYLMPFNKFFDQDRTAFAQNPMDTDYIYMRVDEFHLLNAEAKAKNNNEPGAKTRLIDFLSTRFSGGTAEATTYVNGLSGQALKDAIYLQTRIEFWGEGKSYFAMKRNQATITRGTNHAFQPGISVAYDDDRLSFQIPDTEIINNPAITGQN